jgi:hypothetical protein
MDFLPDGTLYLEDPAALKIPPASERPGATTALPGPGSRRRLEPIEPNSAFLDDGSLRVTDPDALAVPDPNTWRTADPITPAKPISGSGSTWEWDWETGHVRETWMNTIQQDQHEWEKVGKSWDWLAGCCEECATGIDCCTTTSSHFPSDHLLSDFIPSLLNASTSSFSTSVSAEDLLAYRAALPRTRDILTPEDIGWFVRHYFPCLGFDPCEIGFHCGGPGCNTLLDKCKEQAGRLEQWCQRIKAAIESGEFSVDEFYGPEPDNEVIGLNTLTGALANTIGELNKCCFGSNPPGEEWRLGDGGVERVRDWGPDGGKLAGFRGSIEALWNDFLEKNGYPWVVGGDPGAYVVCWWEKFHQAVTESRDRSFRRWVAEFGIVQAIRMAFRVARERASAAAAAGAIGGTRFSGGNLAAGAAIGGALAVMKIYWLISDAMEKADEACGHLKKKRTVKLR